MSRVLLVVVIIFAVSCKSQNLTTCDKQIEDIQWLTKLLEGRKNAAVFSFKYNKELILEYHHCYQCPDAIVTFYRCDGDKICEQGGFLGTNTCPDFGEITKNKIYPIE